MVERAQAEARVGSVIADKYELQTLLGHGGMGSVYGALHRFTGRRVAVKLMHAGLAQVSGLSKRFVREARAPSAIGHPGLVDVLDGGEDANGELYLVMEYLDGGTLGSALRDAELDGLELVNIVVELLDVLAAAHAAGFMHRDIKPDNIFITEPTERAPRRVKLLDFGIAGLLHGVDATQLTATGAVLGTPSYMSPEQASGRRVDATSDVWAVGAMLYRGFAGRPPYPGNNYNEIVVAIASTEHPPLASLRPDLPRDLTEVVDRALARDPADRFRDASEMHRALQAAARDPRLLDAELRRKRPDDERIDEDATPLLSAAGPRAAATVPRRRRAAGPSPPPPGHPRGAATHATAVTRVEAGAMSRPDHGSTSVRPRSGARALVWVMAALTVLAAAGVIGARLQRRNAAAETARTAAVATAQPPGEPTPSATDTASPRVERPPSKADPTEHATAVPDESGPAPKAAPTAKATGAAEPAPRASAGVSTAELSSVVASGRAALKSCHQTAIAEGHRDNVNLEVDLSVDTTGRVSEATTRGPAPPGMSACVIQEVKRWRFTPPDVRTEVSFPIEFEAVVVEL